MMSGPDQMHNGKNKENYKRLALVIAIGFDMLRILVIVVRFVIVALALALVALALALHGHMFLVPLGHVLILPMALLVVAFPEFHVPHVSFILTLHHIELDPVAADVVANYPSPQGNLRGGYQICHLGHDIGGVLHLSLIRI